MKVLCLAMKDSSTEEVNLGVINSRDDLTLQKIKHICGLRLKSHCEKNNKDNVIGAVMFLEPRYKDVRYIYWKQEWIPTSYRYLTPLLIYKNKNIEEYVPSDP